MHRLSRSAILLAGLAACDTSTQDPATRPLFSSIDSIASPAPSWSAEPNLTADGDGRVYLSWLERQSDSTYALRLARQKDEGWEQPGTIAASDIFFVNWADFPSVVALGKEHLAAHWLQRSGPGKYSYDVHVAQSLDGGRTWSGGVVPHRDSTESEHGFASIWPENDGFALAWLDGRKYSRAEGDVKNEMMLVQTSVGRDGTLGPETRLDQRICDCCQTSVAMTNLGPIIVYRDRSPEEVRDIYIVRRIGSVWKEPKPVSRDNWEIDACPVNGPAVAAHDLRVVVAWFTGAGDTARVKVAFSDDGGETFGAPVRVDDGNPAGRVDVALLKDGAALVSWVENVEGTHAEVRVRRVPEGAERGGAREPGVTVARSTAARASGFPRMALSGDDVIFAWTVPGATRNEPSHIRVARARLADQ